MAWLSPAGVYFHTGALPLPRGYNRDIETINPLQVEDPGQPEVTSFIG
jgi:hypothetical protein